MLKPSPVRAPLAALCGMIFASLASPASAAPEPKTRLIDCGAESCLLVTGHRPSAGSAVSINGHAVAVKGDRKWQARIPLETVRRWSPRFARTITVSVGAGASASRVETDLPIGSLGQAPDLAFLVVTAK